MGMDFGPVSVVFHQVDIDGVAGSLLVKAFEAAMLEANDHEECRGDKHSLSIVVAG
jgi:hypothetical protein